MVEEQQNFDKDFMYYIIDRVIPFPLILEKAGYENYDYYGNVYCPFHDNTDTPAAKLYKNKRGDTLYCFGECRRTYRPSDVMKRGMIKDRVQTVFHRIWNEKLSEEKKAVLKEEFGEEVDFLNDEFRGYIKEMEKFKKGVIEYDDYLDLVVKAVNSLG